MFTSASTSRLMLPSSRSRQQSVHSQMSDLASAADGEEEEEGGMMSTNGQMPTSNSRRKVNRSNPQMSYAYGASSDGRQPAKKPRLSKETSNQGIGASSDSITPPPPIASSMAPVDAATRYKAVREKQQQKRQMKGGGGAAAEAKRNGQSPRRSARLSTNGSQDATSKYERREAIDAIEEDQAVEDEEEEEEEEKVTNSVMLPSTLRLTSPGQSKSVNAHLSSFYLDAGRGNMDAGVEFKEKRNGLPTSLLRGAQRVPREMPSPHLNDDFGMNSIRSSDLGNSQSNNYEEEERYASMMDQRAVGSVSNLASAIIRSPKALFQGKGTQNGKLNHEVMGDTSSEKKKRRGRVSNEDKVYKPQTEDGESEGMSEVSEEGRKHGHRRRKIDGKMGARGGRDDNKIWKSTNRRKGGKRVSQGGEDDSEVLEEEEGDVDEGEIIQELADQKSTNALRARLEKLKTYNWKSKVRIVSRPWWAYALATLLLFASINFHKRDHSRVDYDSISKYQMPSSGPKSLSDVSKRIKTLEATYEALKVAGTNAAKDGKDLANRIANLESDSVKFSKKYATSHTALQEALIMIQGDSSVIQKEMDKITLRLDGIHSKSKIENKAVNDALERRLRELESQMKQNDKLLDQISEKAESAETIALQTKQSFQWLEKKLPSEIAVPVQKGTNKPILDASTWQELKQMFIARDDVNFQRRNEEAIRALSMEMIDNQVQTGAIMSRELFLELLQNELEQVKGNLETQFNANVGEMQDDILAKIRMQQEMFEKAGSWNKNKPSSSSSSSSSSILDVDNIDMLTKDGSNAKEAILTLIEGALEVYSADRIARRDYALYSAGGRVIPSLTSPTYKLQTPSFFNWRSSGSGRQDLAKPPVVALHHDSTPGMCWAFHGEDGQLGIGLARKVIVSDITLEHVPASISLEAGTSAPRDVTIWGLVERQIDRDRLSTYRQGKDTSSSFLDDSPAPAPPSSNHLLLASFTYDAHSTRSIQTFSASIEAKYLQIPVSVVQVRISSNHGNKDFTCLYRIRVHGQEWTWDNETSL